MEKAAGSELEATVSRKRVLVVDDEMALRQLFQLVLTRHGYEVLQADDGVQGLALVEREPVDLVITDLVMPEKDGIETIRGLHGRYPNLKIIAISGAFDGNFLKVAKAMGAHAVLLKPISIQNLLCAVKGLLEAR